MKRFTQQHYDGFSGRNLLLLHHQLNVKLLQGIRSSWIGSIFYDTSAKLNRSSRMMSVFQSLFKPDDKVCIFSSLERFRILIFIQMHTDTVKRIREFYIKYNWKFRKRSASVVEFCR